MRRSKSRMNFYESLKKATTDGPPQYTSFSRNGNRSLNGRKPARAKNFPSNLLNGKTNFLEASRRNL